MEQLPGTILYPILMGVISLFGAACTFLLGIIAYLAKTQWGEIQKKMEILDKSVDELKVSLAKIDMNFDNLQRSINARLSHRGIP